MYGKKNITMKIVLVGYMGSGKSTIGRLLANKLAVAFIDLDDYLEAEYGMTIKDIFDKKGIIFFRKAERNALKELVKSTESYVLATGGGAPCYGDNMKLITASSDAVVYLKMNIPDLIVRLLPERSQRPLISHLKESEMAEFLGKHLFERAPYYNQASIVLSVQQQSPEAVVIQIQKDLGLLNA